MKVRQCLFLLDNALIFPQLIEKNKGKAHAFNIGLGFAKGELVLSNDADTVPEPDSLNRYIN